jgi:hypothetical protein
MSAQPVPAVLAGEFETILRGAMKSDPDLEHWRFGPDLAVAGFTPGRAPANENVWTPDREIMIGLVRWTTELRAERCDGERVLPVLADWRDELRPRFGLTVEAGVGGGWRDLLVAAFEIAGTAPQVRQIKEKFGELRAYGIGDLGWYVQTLSGHICEVCGAPGTLRHGSWWVTRCDEHVGKSPWSE